MNTINNIQIFFLRNLTKLKSRKADTLMHYIRFNTAISVNISSRQITKISTLFTVHVPRDIVTGKNGETVSVLLKFNALLYIINLHD